jgi:uncharacterized protein YajQ (UPF0234 family)
MPSFDIVSELELFEVNNAVSQAAREVDTRFDFKGSGAKFEQNEHVVVLKAQSDFQLQQMLDILYNKLTKRKIDIRCAQAGEPQMSGQEASQTITLRTGIETELARQIVKTIKGSKLKLQAAIQGEQVRVSGKKRDDLQSAIDLIKESKISLPLQYVNFRD